MIEFLIDLLNMEFNLGKTSYCPSKNIDLEYVQTLLKEIKND